MNRGNFISVATPDARVSPPARSVGPTMRRRLMKMRLEECVWAAAVVCLVGVVRDVSSIKCYECNTKGDAACADPFNATAAHLVAKECVFDSRPPLETILSSIAQLAKVPEVLISPQGPVIFPSLPTTCQKIDIIVLGERITGRGCTGPDINKVSSCDSVKLVTSADLQLESCSICDADACNSATPTSTSWLVLVAVGALVHVIHGVGS